MPSHPLILLPGWGMPPSVFTPLQFALQKHFAIIPVHWHGIDHSDGYCTHVEQVLAELDCNHVTILAWSLGSLVALETASKHTCVKRLILFGATSRFTRDDASEYGAGWPSRVVARMQRKLDSDLATVLADFDQAMFSDAEKARGMDSSLQEEIAVSRAAFSATDLRVGLDYLLQADIRARLPEIRCPVLLVHGEQDAICPPIAMNTIAAGVSGLVHSIALPETGHVPFYAQPALCAALMEEWITRHDDADQ